MHDRVGEDFDAMILSATKYGLFVELTDLFVEGLVPIQSLGALDNDHYTFRENTREIIGEHWGRRFRIGQRVHVLLDRIDAVQKRLQFSIIDGESGLASPPNKSTPFSPVSRESRKVKSKSKKDSKRKAKPSMQRQAPSRTRSQKRKRRSAANKTLTTCPRASDKLNLEWQKSRRARKTISPHSI